jgi:hypothetical protein
MSGNVDLGDPLHVHQSCTGCNYGVYKVDISRSQNNEQLSALHWV